MFRLKNAFAISLILSALPLILHCTTQSQPDNYTATLVVGGVEMHMARLKDNTRIENPILKGVVVLSYGNKKKTITMNTSKKKYFEEPTKEQPPTIYDRDVTIEKKAQGDEQINGHPCKVYDVTYYRKDKPNETYRAKVWEAFDLNGLAVKVEQASPDGSGVLVTTELKNVELNNAKPNMFEVPGDYVKAQDIDEVMGMPVIQDVKKGLKKLMDKLKDN
ncbi:MAG: hypothetical protein CR997_12115 [Acidobacteria bacterium]|nr:MAG: hypothetical protein CR997_12115 [Acidobacteriota bacterium]